MDGWSPSNDQNLWMSLGEAGIPRSIVVGESPQYLNEGVRE